MKTLGIVTRFALAACAIVMLSSTAALADPVTPGSLTPLDFEGGGTVSGFFTFSGDLTQILDWNIVETSSTVNGYTFAAATLTPTNSHVTFNPNFNQGPLQLSYIEVRSNDYPNTNGSKALLFMSERIPTSIPAGGLTLALCSSGGIICNDPGFIGFHSGEFEAHATTANPFGYEVRNIASGFFTISDPEGTWNFNASKTAVLIPNDGGNGGGDGTPVPEPATLAMLGFGVALTVGAGRNRRK